MSRSQESSVVDTAKGQNAGYYNNAQNSYSQAQTDVGNYEKQLADYAGDVSKFSASNPYVKGGEFQTSTNQQLSNTADAGARSAGEALQGQALRTGQNTAGSIAATEAMEQQGTRDLASEEAKATQQRIGSEAGYNKEALDANQSLVSDTAVPAQLETTLSGQQGSLAGGALSTEEQAAKQPSWMDEFGNTLASGLGNLAISGAQAGIKACWIASELYGGWFEPRTVLVREWLNTEFTKHLPGRIIMYLYRRYGFKTARLIKEYPALRFIFLPLFNRALAKARG